MGKIILFFLLQLPVPLPRGSPRSEMSMAEVQFSTGLGSRHGISILGCEGEINWLCTFFVVSVWQSLGGGELAMGRGAEGIGDDCGRQPCRVIRLR